MTYQEDNINLCKTVFDDKNYENKLWACLGKPCSRSLFVCLSQLFVILPTLFGCFLESSSFKNVSRINCLDGNFV